LLVEEARAIAAATDEVGVRGLAVPGLVRIVQEKRAGRNVALVLVRKIGKATEKYRPQIDYLYCPLCFNRFGKYTYQLGWAQSVNHYGCRACGNSRDPLQAVPVVALDRTLVQKSFNRVGEVVVNWLALRRVFDFTRVEIRQASDEDVERFVIQIGNDTDSVRKQKYSTLPVLVSKECALSENTIQLLKRYFGQVDVVAK
ncbi:MAG: hypothetical protein AAF485_33275, partial [Chloroflexota bacterium]